MGRKGHVGQPQGPSWRPRSQPQPVNQAQDLSEQASRECDFGELERDIATVSNDLDADLDLLLSTRRPAHRRRASIAAAISAGSSATPALTMR